MVLGGIADQARYGPSRICILFIEEYMQDPQNLGLYLFSANSSACSGIIGLASAGLLFALLIGSVSLYYIIRSEFRAVRLIFGMALTSALYTVIALIMAAVATAGINRTCSEFQSEGFSCSTIFTGGFFESNTQQTYSKSLGIINMSVVSAWFCFVSWACYTALEWLNWRNSGE
ncbi:hypothetical protein HDV05_002824 [Chytridiales sp. JEL 0842]|nr:hypothetical protein HDV05_002824 [Chytridiales sp. JEL 0842]